MGRARGAKVLREAPVAGWSVEVGTGLGRQDRATRCARLPGLQRSLPASRPRCCPVETWLGRLKARPGVEALTEVESQGPGCSWCRTLLCDP